MENRYDYEEELAEKDREIERLENNLDSCHLEIARLRKVCRRYEELLRKQEIDGEGETNEDYM